jgi:hypothetical protein
MLTCSWSLLSWDLANLAMISVRRQKYIYIYIYLGSGARPTRRLTTLPPSVNRFSKPCRILNISQPYRPPRSDTGKALPYFSYVISKCWDPRNSPPPPNVTPVEINVSIFNVDTIQWTSVDTDLHASTHTHIRNRYVPCAMYHNLRQLQICDLIIHAYNSTWKHPLH